MKFRNLYPSVKHCPDPFADRAEKGSRCLKVPPARDVLHIPKRQNPSLLSYTWLGHASVFLQIDGCNFLIDPVFSRCLSPVPPFGPKRFPGQQLCAADFPEVDAVLITHSHFDHLDRTAIRALDPQVKRYVVPLGIRRLLLSFGIAPEKITELDWWEDCSISGVRITCTPGQHNSARSLWDADTTLWCSYVLNSETDTIFFSGDTGFGNHFRDIAERFGPVDLVFMECGQYGEHWHHMHMFPEESAEACGILKAGLSVPIHWGTYSLALHAWDEPPKRFARRMEELQLTCQVPVLYRTVELP